MTPDLWVTLGCVLLTVTFLVATRAALWPPLTRVERARIEPGARVLVRRRWRLAYGARVAQLHQGGGVSVDPLCSKCSALWEEAVFHEQLRRRVPIEHVRAVS